MASALGNMGTAWKAKQAMDSATAAVNQVGNAAAGSGGNASDEPPREPSCCFPCEPFRVFGPLCCFLPATWQKIQDCTHATLVIGVISCVFLILKNAIVIFGVFSDGSDGCFVSEEEFCAPELGSIIFGILLFCYVSGIISQWDEQLMSKEEAAKAAKEKLLNSYNELLSDMDGLLTNATESASGLAERSFESKRRDFQRFLERAKTRFSSVAQVGSSDEHQMLQQFRKFCVHWLGVFKECSIDPVNRPQEVVTADELESCVSIVEVADKCLERLRITEVKFISGQRDKDKQQLGEQQMFFKRHQPKQGSKVLAITAGGQSAAQQEPQKEDAELQTKKPTIRASWVKFGSVGFQCSCSGYPQKCGSGCVEISCLSAQHSRLIFVFFLGLAITAMEVIRFIWAINEGEEGLDLVVRVLSIFFVFLAIYCLIVVLLKFEEIDTVQKLEREVQDLQAQNKEVGEQREKMKEFWNSAQNLTELWLYRTVPRLDLYKELHSQLEDENEEDLLTNITGANNALEALETNLGALEAWRNDGDLKTDDKKLFGKTINELCQMGDMGDILHSLTDDVIKGPVMLKLKNLN